MADLLKGIDYKIFNHVKRNGKRAADFLANWGCKDRNSKIDNQWRMLRPNREWEDLAGIINYDHEQATNENRNIHATDR